MPRRDPLIEQSGPIQPYYEDDAVTLYHGDCREVLPSLPDVGVRGHGKAPQRGRLMKSQIQESVSIRSWPATALCAYILSVRESVENEWEMPCPAAGGLLCGADDCLANGCVEERDPA